MNTASTEIKKTARCQDAALTVEHAVMRCTFLKRGKTMKKTLIQKLGLLGVLSLLSYTAAVIFAPLAYPGYDWMAQAVSDLSAANAPSLALWNQLTAFYNVREVVCVTVVCIGIQGQKPSCCARAFTCLPPWSGSPPLATGCFPSRTAATRARFRM